MKHIFHFFSVDYYKMFAITKRFTQGSLRAIWKMYQAEENHVIADLSDIVAPR